MHFQSNPTTGDRRTSGSAASLTGIEAALESQDRASLQTAIDRLISAYAIVFGFGGIPLLYMGDELGLLNDHSFLEDPTKAEDNRWIHRPAMNWDLVKRARNKEGVEGAIFSAFKSLIKARQRLGSLHAATTSEVSTLAGGSVLVINRKHASGDLIQIYNLSESTHYIERNSLLQPHMYEHISAQEMHFDQTVAVPPYSSWWLTSQR